MLVGIVGKSGAGKSTLVKLMKNINSSIMHVEIDKIGHDILKDQEVIDRILDIVGDPSVLVDGMLDRKKVGNIIFNDLKKYQRYYDYTEKIEYAIIDKIISDNEDKIIVLDWILLDNTKYWGKLDYKILINTEYNVRKNRVVLRDNIKGNYFDLRENMKDSYNEGEMDFILNGNNINEDVVRNLLGELK